MFLSLSRSDDSDVCLVVEIGARQCSDNVRVCFCFLACSGFRGFGWDFACLPFAASRFHYRWPAKKNMFCVCSPLPQVDSLRIVPQKLVLLVGPLKIEPQENCLFFSPSPQAPQH